MILKILKYVILFLVAGNIPAFTLLYFGPTYGSAVSYLSSILLIVFFVLAQPKHKPLLPFFALGILYFGLSSLNPDLVIDENYFIKEFIRFMILIICAPVVLKRSSHADFFFIILIGALSVIINALVFPESNILYNLVIGRFSGIYLNPNSAGTACLIGFALSYAMKNAKWRYLGQFIFTLAGLFTLSRTFIVIWLLINVVAIYRDKRNMWVPFIGAMVLAIVFTFTDTSIFAPDRFKALTSIFNEGPVDVKTINHGSRTESWAEYYDLIEEKPLLGHGFGVFQRTTKTSPGVHNSFLMVIGEAGIIPFLLFVGIYIYLFLQSLKYFNQHPEFLYCILVIILALMASHMFFLNYFSVFISMYLYTRIREIANQKQIKINAANWN